MQTFDYYEILGVPKNASQEEIKRAYRELTKKYHPDHKNPEWMLKTINIAYLTLRDEKLRKDYDSNMSSSSYEDNKRHNYENREEPEDEETDEAESEYEYSYKSSEAGEATQPKMSKDIFSLFTPENIRLALWIIGILVVIYLIVTLWWLIALVAFLYVIFEVMNADSSKKKTKRERRAR